MVAARPVKSVLHNEPDLISGLKQSGLSEIFVFEKCFQKYVWCLTTAPEDGNAFLLTDRPTHTH